MFILKKVSEPNKYLNILKDGSVQMEQASNLVVVKTAAGMAMKLLRQRGSFKSEDRRNNRR